jgi:hypothetical protein
VVRERARAGVREGLVERGDQLHPGSILPREIRGQSSIMYVDPTHAASKPRRYTVFVDEPIELP